MTVIAAEWTDVARAISDIVVAIFTLAATTGIYLVYTQVRLQRKQLHREFENLYVEIYWTIMDRLEGSRCRSRSRASAIAAYLMLAEDQCDMRQQNRVTDETWSIWGPAIYCHLM